MAFGKIKRSSELFKQAWVVLKSDPALMLFPILSIAATLAVVASFAVPVLLSDDLRAAFSDLSESSRASRHGEEAAEATSSGGAQLTAVAIMFAFYFATSFVTIFFNAALLGAADRKFRGESGGVRDGIAVAMTRLPQILGWTLVSAVIGTILRALEERVGLLGRIVIALVGVAWAIASYFVLPALVIDGLGPVAALKRSASVIKQTWGEGLVLATGFGIAGILVSLLTIGVIVVGVIAGVVTQSIVVGVIIGGIGVLALIAWMIVASTLRSIVQVALYRFATDGVVPNGFDTAAMHAAFAAKKK